MFSYMYLCMQMQVFTALKTSDSWSNSQPTDTVYKRQEQVFSLKGMWSTQQPSLSHD